jgi:DNA polymerase-1
VVAVDVPVLLAIDGNSLVHRSYHSQAHTGQPNWAVRGLLTQLVAAVDRIRPVCVVVGFDDPDASVRRDRWPSYKAQRTEKLESLVEQLAQAACVLRELGVAVVVPAGLEADDVLASCAAFATARNARTVIATSDRDAFALIDDTTTVLRIINGGADASPIMTAERLVTLCGVRPAQYRDFAALRGDPSDNLPGVHGIGPRSAARLLCEFGSAAAAFDDLDGVRARLGAGVASRLAEPSARSRWELNCRVMTMHHDVDLGIELHAGAGALPFDADVVDRVYREQTLTWTAGQAVRVLADVDPDEVRPPRVTASLPWFESWGGGRPSLPKLPPRKPKVEQLSLFDC